MSAGKYTIVGQVIDGMDVLDKMEKIKVGKLILVVTAALCLSLVQVVPVLNQKPVLQVASHAAAAASLSCTLQALYSMPPCIFGCANSEHDICRGQLFQPSWLFRVSCLRLV